MPRIIRNTLLNYISTDFIIEQKTNPARIYELNSKPIRKGEIVYLCEREIRAKDNFALQFAIEKSKELNFPLKIIHPKINIILLFLFFINSFIPIINCLCNFVAIMANKAYFGLSSE